jgi:hypothetical protein
VLNQFRYDTDINANRKASRRHGVKQGQRFAFVLRRHDKYIDLAIEPGYLSVPFAAISSKRLPQAGSIISRKPFIGQSMSLTQRYIILASGQPL